MIENIFAFARQDLSSFVLVQLNMFLSLVSLGSLSFSFSYFLILFLVLTYYNHFLSASLVSLQGQVDKYMLFRDLFDGHYGAMSIMNNLNLYTLC